MNENKKEVAQEVSDPSTELKPIHSFYPLCNDDVTVKPHIEVSYPIAEEIISMIVEKKISYAEACEALNIANTGIKTLVLIK